MTKVAIVLPTYLEISSQDGKLRKKVNDGECYAGPI